MCSQIRRSPAPMRRRSADSSRRATSAKSTSGLKTSRRSPTSYWVTQFGKIARKASARHRSGGLGSVDVDERRKRAADRLSRDRRNRWRSRRRTPNRLQSLLQKVKGATSVNSTGTQLAPDISIQFDRNKAQALGVDLGQAAQAVGRRVWRQRCHAVRNDRRPRTSASRSTLSRIKRVSTISNRSRSARPTAVSSISAISRVSSRPPRRR